MRDRDVLRLVDVLSSLSAVTRRRSSNKFFRTATFGHSSSTINCGGKRSSQACRSTWRSAYPGPGRHDELLSRVALRQRRPSESWAAFEACQSCLLYSHRDGRISAATIRGRFPDLRRILRPIGAPFPVPRRAGRMTDRRETGVSRFPPAFPGHIGTQGNGNWGFPGLPLESNP